MSRYYMGKQARAYNTRLRAFTDRTLSAALALVDMAALHVVAEEQGRPPRALDVACGTGVLLLRLLARMPTLEATGIDASADMLAEARVALAAFPQVRLEQVGLGADAAALPFAPGTFDLITCTNALHAMPDPLATLVELRHLLAAGGQLVLEDFARRPPPFPWPAFAWLVRRVAGGHVRVYTLAEARSLCQQAGLRVVGEQAFRIDWLLHGWALRASGNP